MINDTRQYIWTSPALIMYPGSMIFLAVPAFNIPGDGLRDSQDMLIQARIRCRASFTFLFNFVNKIGKMLVLIPKEDPWSSLVNSLDQFTDDFMDERDQPGQKPWEPF